MSALRERPKVRYVCRRCRGKIGDVVHMRSLIGTVVGQDIGAHYYERGGRVAVIATAAQQGGQ